MEASNPKLDVYFQFVFPLCAHQKASECLGNGQREGFGELSLAGDVQALLGCPQKGQGVLLSRTLLENPASSPSRMGNSKSQSPHAVSNWENSLRKVKFFLLPFIRTRGVSSQEFSPSPWGGNIWGLGLFSPKGLPTASLDTGFWQLNLQMMNFVGDLLLSGSITMRHQAQACWSHWSPWELPGSSTRRNFCDIQQPRFRTLA